MAPGYYRALWLVAFLGMWWSAPDAAAKGADKGLLLEVGPDLSVSRASDGSPVSLDTAAFVNLEAWGAGPFGFMAQVKRGVGTTDVELSDSGVITTVRDELYFHIGPTVNVGGGPFRLRIGGGPWFGYSQMSEESLSDLSEHDIEVDWTTGTFQGIAFEARLDLNTWIISPFVMGQVRTLGALWDDSGVTRSGNHEITDMRATGGLRLNVIPFVKLAFSGYVGYSQSGGMNPLAPSGAAITTYGTGVWLVLAL